MERKLLPCIAIILLAMILLPVKSSCEDSVPPTVRVTMNSSEFHGQTITVDAFTELHVIVDDFPSEVSTLILAGGELSFESGRMKQALEDKRFVVEVPFDSELMSWFNLDLQSGEIKFENGNFQGTEFIPHVGPGVTLALSNSDFCHAEDPIVICGGVASVKNCLFDSQSNSFRIHNNSIVELINTTLCNSVSQSLEIEYSTVSVDSCTFLTNNAAIQCAEGSELLVDFSLFQGNQTAVRITSEYNTTIIRESAFYGNWIYDVQNLGAPEVDARENYWFPDDEGVCNGDVNTDDPNISTPIEPETFGDDDVIITPLPPLADGDEPLLWNGVHYTHTGMPMRPTYRIYRSETSPYNVYSEDNFLSTTRDTTWTDPNPPDFQAFYCVTYAINRDIE